TVGTRAARAIIEALITHWASSRLRPKAVIICGNATLTVALFITTRKALSVTVAATHHLYEARSGAIIGPARRVVTGGTGSTAVACLDVVEPWDATLEPRWRLGASPHYEQHHDQPIVSGHSVV